jgi:hypothetical protein
MLIAIMSSYLPLLASLWEALPFQKNTLLRLADSFLTMVSFEVFGDSNIAKSWKAIASESDRLKGSVLRQTTTQISLRDSLKTVGQSTKYALVAALTNPISRIKFEGAAMLGQAVCDVLDEIYDYLLQTVNNNPELKVRPFYLSCVLLIFTQASCSNQPTYKYYLFMSDIHRTSSPALPTLLVQCQFCCYHRQLLRCLQQLSLPDHPSTSLRLSAH